MSSIRPRNGYSVEEDDEIWKFVIQKLKIPNYGPVRTPFGHKIWEDFKKEKGSRRSTSSLSSHFRKQMPRNIMKSTLSKEEIKFLFTEFDWPMSKEEEEILDTEVEAKILIDANEEIEPSTCSDEKKPFEMQTSQETPIFRFTRQRSRLAAAAAILPEDKAPSAKKQRIEPSTSDIKTDIDFAVDSSDNFKTETQEVTLKPIDPIVKPSAQTSSVEKEPNLSGSSDDESIFETIAQNRDSVKRSPQRRPPYINLDIQPVNGISNHPSSADDVVSEKATKIEYIEDMLKNTVIAMLKASGMQTEPSDALLHELYQTPIIQELKLNIWQGIEYMKDIRNKSETLSQMSCPFVE